MERETGIEPATTCLEGKSSTTELLPLYETTRWDRAGLDRLPDLFSNFKHRFDGDNTVERIPRHSHRTTGVFAGIAKDFDEEIRTPVYYLCIFVEILSGLNHS